MRLFNDPQQVLDYMARVRAAGRVRRYPFPEAGTSYGQDDPNAFPSDGLIYDERIVFGARGSIPLASLPNSAALTALNDVIAAQPGAAEPAPPEGVSVSLNVVPFVAGTSSAQVLGANARRSLLLFQNQDGAATMYFQLGQGAGINQGIQLAPGAGLLFDTRVPSNYVTVIATGTAVGVVAEGV